VTTHGNLSYPFVDRIKDYLPDRLLIPATQDFWWTNSTRPAPAPEQEAAYHEAFRERFGYEPDLAPGLGFDAVNNIADALQRTNGDSTSLKDALQTSSGIVGVAGTYNFRPENHRGLDGDDVAMVRLDGGSFVPESKG
jgi:branched-chain amino acid transport system substrate-binding protein